MTFIEIYLRSLLLMYVLQLHTTAEGPQNGSTTAPNVRIYLPTGQHI
jgi:hypothetical protein